MQGRDHLGLVPSVFRYYADLIEEQAADGPQSVGMNGSVVEREPVGVVVAIAPWNYPLWLASGKVSAAIAAGCTVVLKPSSLTPLTAVELAGAFERAGAPPGVFNVVLGPSATVGTALTSDLRVDKVLVHGRDRGRIGRRPRVGDERQAVRPGTRRQEPNIVFADADFERAVEGAIIRDLRQPGRGLLRGQSAARGAARSRRTGSAAIDATRRLRVGYQLDPATDFGPLISSEHRGTVAAAVARAKDEGARLLTGGIFATVDGHELGYYFEPTIFTDVTPDMSLAREEVFGPVLAIQTFDDEREAVELANGTDYGLAAGIWSEDEPAGAASPARSGPGSSSSTRTTPPRSRSRGVASA